jgi:hypothetical protein
MRKTYRACALLIALGVVLQAASIAWGWFDVLVAVEDGDVFTSDTDFNAGQIMHGVVGMTVMPLLALVLLGTSFATKVQGASKWAGLVLLAVVAQVVLAFVAFGVAVVGVLHGLNAIVVLGLALRAARQMAGGDTAAATSPMSVPQQSGAPQQSSSV